MHCEYSIVFVQEMCEFNYLEMSSRETSSTKSKNKNTTQTRLEELYTTDDLTLLKRAIAELTAKRDYKTLKPLFRRNPNASKFDTPKRINDSRNVMVSSAMYLEQFHESRMKKNRMHTHINPDITIQIRDHLNI